MRTLHTIDELLDALGGAADVAALLGFKIMRVYAWRSRGTLLPPDTFIPINRALAARGLRADPHLWSSLPVALFERTPSVLTRAVYAAPK